MGEPWRQAMPFQGKEIPIKWQKRRHARWHFSGVLKIVFLATPTGKGVAVEPRKGGRGSCVQAHTSLVAQLVRLAFVFFCFLAGLFDEGGGCKMPPLPTAT